MKEKKNIINFIKQIILESSDVKDKSVFNPEMYYFVVLYILEHGFDFYSEDIFKYFLLTGYSYFKKKNLSFEEKMYLTIFENEIKNWNPKFIFTEFEDIIIELLIHQQNKIIKELKSKRIKSNNIQQNINLIAKRINRKYRDKNINDVSEDDLLEKLFFDM